MYWIGVTDKEEPKEVVFEASEITEANSQEWAEILGPYETQEEAEAQLRKNL